MKLILATPIYPPKIGGPAQYVKNLAERFKEREIETQAISYNNLIKYPRPLRFFLYFSQLFKATKHYDLIYAFNLISCGFPAFLISKILRKKFIIRLGGDFLWERAIEEGRTKKPLREYYREPKILKEKFWICLIKKILNGADKLIFSSNFQKKIYLESFYIKEEKTIVIPNPFPEISTTNYQSPITNYQLLYAGRFIKLKNLYVLVEVFKGVINKTKKPLILKLIGEGPEEENTRLKIKNLQLEDKVIFQKPISHQELLKEIQNSYLSILPSLTEISPNFALECIKLQKPILLTKETGIYENFKDYLIFIDPRNKEDIGEKIFHLLDKKNYQNYIEKIKNIPTHYSWQDVVKQHISLLKELI